jgi:hypothetical protein
MKYMGGCHCGAVKFEFESNIEGLLSCNCSICAKKGSLLTFVSADAFTLQQGADNLQDYKFNKHIINHNFCKTCGVGSFARASMPDGEGVAINMRCVNDVDLAQFPVQYFDGKSL